MSLIGNIIHNSLETQMRDLNVDFNNYLVSSFSHFNWIRIDKNVK